MSGIFTDLPIDLGAALGISAENAALLLSMAMLIAVAMPIAMLGKKFNAITIAVPMVTMMGFLVSVGWLPYWILLVLGLFIALEVAVKIKNPFG